ncbi:LytR/AlgR family response regulator transcription factor [Eubacterium oxidoreducens]|uniref:Stage 0 sporulation protein A homolog n=1 Tax=Eubacterium oxidoreducens TaxID=1732 RepID=A0A1G6BQY8_EUBOX|nr:LytTR family DNA-binding domain-containing protein [Eubacterium oxidoreducens]SDB23009.1 two component transcriptional regulator, LytTR family [Eubacterium oxidoreducens]
MLKVAVCDDQRAILNQMKQILRQYERDNECEICLDTYQSGNTLLESKEQYDVIFLDVEMPGIGGLKVGKILSKEYMHTKVILLTSHTEVYKEGYKINAFRFLTKPIVEKDVFEALIAVEHSMLGKETVSLRYENAVYNIAQQHILYIMADGSRTVVFVAKQSFTSSKSLREWESSLDQRLFARVHRGYLVNMSHIESVKNGKVKLYSGEQILLSRRLLKDFKRKYMEFDLNYR